jgi:glycosyltransferase involved in cell wall biosynthesis
MNVWYDVSGLYNWEGPFTGIQRVVYNLGKELHVIDDKVQFFIFSDGNFREISYAELEERIAERINTQPANVRKSNSTKNKRALIQHYGMVAAKQMVIDTKFERPLRKTYGGLRRSYRAVRPRKKLQPLETKIFNKDDVVIVVDGNWQFGEYDDRIIAAKKLTRFRLVHMVHDLVAVRNSAFANPGAKKIIGSYFKKIFVAADMLIAVSESTKRDIEWFIEQNHLKTDAKLQVLLEGNSLSATDKRVDSKPDTPLPSSFILSVSTIEIRKNYMEFFYAYKLAHQKGIELPHLVIAGRKGWMAEEVFTLLTEDVDIKDRITVLQGPPDSQLAWLYRHCLFTVTPAFYEGWGLTVAEAFSFGKACISSNTSSMPEVGKDLALYVSPYDPAQLMATIVRLMDLKERRSWEARIRAGYKQRTWRAAAEELSLIVKREM